MACGHDSAALGIGLSVAGGIGAAMWSAHQEQVLLASIPRGVDPGVVRQLIAEVKRLRAENLALREERIELQEAILEITSDALC